jgi:imidazolonepropionase-like amidohydrolase
MSALELVRLCRAGLTPMEGLVAGTTGAAAACGLAAHVGAVAPGMAADMIVVDGDPLAEPEVLLDEARIWLVIQSGRPTAGAALEARLPGLPIEEPGVAGDPVPALAGRPVSPPPQL